jgi:CRP/FNR family transcriptional regulator, anaerobic regulatory protein
MHIAKQTCKEAILNFSPGLSEEALQYLEEGMRIQELANKHFYVHSGEVQKHIGFVYSGLLRTFYIDDNGNDITVRFSRENTYATDYVAFIKRAPSKYFIQCLEPSVLVNLEYNHIQKGYQLHHGLENYGRLIAEEVLKGQQKRIESFLFDKAEQRYLDFVNDSPDLFNRVSLTYLSSYLGIERVSLSRIRKKLSQK